MHKENMKKKRRDLEQASLDAASDLLDTDSNATFAMVLTSQLSKFLLLLNIELITGKQKQKLSKLVAVFKNISKFLFL